MSQTRYEVVLSPRAKRAIERDLPEAVAFAVVALLYGPLAEDPYRDRQAPSLGDYGLVVGASGVSTASSTRSTRTGFWCASCASLTELTCTADAITDRSARATEAVCLCGMSPSDTDLNPHGFHGRWGFSQLQRRHVRSIAEGLHPRASAVRLLNL